MAISCRWVRCSGRSSRAARRVADAFAALGRRLTIEALRRHLFERRQDGLWPFHTGRLVTATDSALILLGLDDRDGIEALERFSAGAAGYLPQLWSGQGEPHRMREDPSNRHWRQPDFATTCLIRGLRARNRVEREDPSRDHRGRLRRAGAGCSSRIPI